MLAALLLRAGEVVPMHRLVDDVWGEDPPSSAAHSLEAYVSRLRRILAPCGAVVERIGSGYRLAPGDLALDSAIFRSTLEEATIAAAAGAHAEAAELAGAALELWTGPALAGVSLHGGGRAEIELLEELRLRALETRIDADLALARHAELVGELRPHVDANPYRERLVSQLMLALYRSGRQAEALALYERTRRALADDLGIQPSEGLQRLSGEIVRQDPRLVTPAAVAERLGRPSAPPRRRVRVPALAAVVVGVAVVALGAAWVLGGANLSDARSATRVALVLPSAPRAGRGDTFATPYVDGLLQSRRDYNVETRTLVLDPLPESLLRIGRELRKGDYDLVLSAGLSVGSSLYPEVYDLPDTEFVFIDGSLRETPLRGRANATGLPFVDDEAGFLAGYLGGLVVGQAAHARKDDPVVSVIGGANVPAVRALVRGFSRGARKASSGIAVRVSYSDTFNIQSSCERIANRQIDHGSTLVFAPAGACGFGALSAAGLRGVWGVGADADRSYLGSHILASTVKRYDRAVLLAVRWFVEGSLPGGRDVALGMDDEAVGITGISPEVSPSIRRKLAHVAASLRQAEASADE